MNNLGFIFKRYSVPGIFFAIGITMILVGVPSKQSPMWFIASFMTLVAGIFSMAFSGGFLKEKSSKLVGLVLGVASFIALGLSWNSIEQTSTHNKMYKHSFEVIKQNLDDIRTAQKAYREIHGVYAPNWEKLEGFIKNGMTPEVITKGVVPARKLTPGENMFIYKDNRAIDNNMTEEEAYKLSKSVICPADLKNFKRDTIMVSFYQKTFLNKTYIERRNKNNFGKFHIDSLRYIPFTNGKEKFTIATVDSLLVGSEKLPALEVKGKLPYAKVYGSSAREDIYFGSLTLPELSGSWE